MGWVGSGMRRVWGCSSDASGPAVALSARKTRVWVVLLTALVTQPASDWPGQRASTAVATTWDTTARTGATAWVQLASGDPLGQTVATRPWTAVWVFWMQASGPVACWHRSHAWLHALARHPDASTL